MDGSTTNRSETMTISSYAQGGLNNVSWTASGGTIVDSTSKSDVGADDKPATATFTAPAATESDQTITVGATSTLDSTISSSLTLTVVAKPAITSTGLDLTSQVGTAYNVTLKVTGGIAPYTWALTGGGRCPRA